LRADRSTGKSLRLDGTLNVKTVECAKDIGSRLAIPHGATLCTT